MATRKKESGNDRLKKRGTKLVWVEVTLDQHREISHDAVDAGIHGLGKFLVNLWQEWKKKRE